MNLAAPVLIEIIIIPRIWDFFWFHQWNMMTDTVSSIFSLSLYFDLRISTGGAAPRTQCSPKAFYSDELRVTVTRLNGGVKMIVPPQSISINQSISQSVSQTANQSTNQHNTTWKKTDDLRPQHMQVQKYSTSWFLGK